MKHCSSRFGLQLLITVVVFAQHSEHPMLKQFDEAERRIVRLPPTRFPELPPNIARDLQKRGCEIPQDELNPGSRPNNVIKGEFFRAGQTDWAILCSVEGVSSILVFPNGSEKNVASIGSAKDRNYLEGEATGIIFSRLIKPFGKRSILNIRRDEGIVLPRIDHAGILDAFADKTSGVWYFDGAEWRIL